MPKVTALSLTIFLVASFICAQETAKTSKPGSAKTIEKATSESETKDPQKQLALDLLMRSHALNEEVEERHRLDMLRDQVRAAVPFDKALARQWGHELFDLAKKTQNRSAGYVQFMAIDALSMQDPEEALVMLGQVDAEALAPADGEFPGATTMSITPRNIFTSLVRKDGKSAIPKLLAAANALGDKGRFPYFAMMGAAAETKDEAVIENTANRLMARFQQGLDSAPGGFDFGEMLSQYEHQWPKEKLKAAVDLAVEAVQKYPVNDENKNFHLTIRTAKGSGIARGPVEMGLLKMSSLVKKVDPDLWVQLTKTYPNLTTAPEQGPGSGITSMTLSVGGESSPIAHVLSGDQQKQQALMEIQRLIWENPEKADKAISAIGDPATKSEALNMAARMISRKSPERSALYAAESEKMAAQVEDPNVRFESACTRLRSDAMSKDHNATVEDLEKAFQLADKIMRKARDDGQDTGYLIGPLLEATQESVKIEPELTIAHIESIYLPYEKAQLLVAAASALAASRPVRQQTAGKPESAAKQSR